MFYFSVSAQIWGVILPPSEREGDHGVVEGEGAHDGFGIVTFDYVGKQSKRAVEGASPYRLRRTVCFHATVRVTVTPVGANCVRPFTFPLGKDSAPRCEG